MLLISKTKLMKRELKPSNYNKRNAICFSIIKISFIYLMTSIDTTNDQNTMAEFC